MPSKQLRTTITAERSCRPRFKGTRRRARGSPHNTNRPPIDPSARGSQTEVKWDKAPRLGGLVPFDW